MKRIFYLVYYLWKLDWAKFRTFLTFVHGEYNLSSLRILTDIFLSSIRYNISVLEYFQFGFYRISKKERKTYAGTGYMYEYQLAMNPRKERVILDDKRLFYKKYGKFIRHKVADTNDLLTVPGLSDSLLSNPGGSLVFKVFNGKCGQKVAFRRCDELTPGKMIEFMSDNGFDLVEEFIIQHSDMSRLSPSAVNTVRIFTQLNSNNQVELLGCRLRISVDSPVDNMAAGNLAAAVDEKTGIIEGPGVYSDITKHDETIHPVTGIMIKGFQVPYWAETISMVREAALLNPQNRSIGWDIAITSNGPDLIEGNHDWCKLVWQLPVKCGLKPVLDRHLSEFIKSRRK